MRREILQQSARLAALLLLSGCATGFNREGLQQRLAGQPLEVNDADIRAALAKKGQLRFPIRVAVHLAAETYRPGDGRAPYRARPEDWRWSVKDKEQLARLAEPLKQAGVVSDLYVMSEMISASDDPKSIRLAAAKHGADVVLLIKGVAQIDDYVDASSILNLLVLPGFLVPSSHRDVLLMMQGAMWDVGNEFLYLSTDAESEAKIRGPTFRIKDSDAVDAAKEEALENFGVELAKRMKALKESAAK